MTTRSSALLAVATLSVGAAVAAGLNHAPADDSTLTVRDRPVTIDVLANDPGVTASTDLRLYRHPAHGSASVVGRRVVYTPAPGFAGRDRIQYSVKTGRSFGIASVEILVGDAVVLDGAVTDAGGNAHVAAGVGGHVFRARAGADGRYRLEVIGLPGDMVTLSASSGDVALLAVPGTVGRLRGEAGADGVLTRDENSQVQLSRLSSALAYLLQLANGGAPVASEAGLHAALGAYDAAALLEMAAAIKLVADGDYPLPAGITDTLALISDADAYRAFIAAVDADDALALRVAALATMFDDAVLPIARPEDFLGARSLASPAAGGNVRVGLIEGERLDLQAGGAGQFHATHPTADPSAGWTFGAGSMRVVPHAPAVTEEDGWLDGIATRRLRSVERLDHRLLVEGLGSGRDLVAVTVHTRLRYPDNPGAPDELYTAHLLRLSYRDGATGIPFVAAEIPGVRTLPLHRPEAFTLSGGGDATQGHAPHRFLPGGTGIVLDDGQAFTWSLEADGNLSLAYADGEHMRVRRLMRDGRKGEGVLASFVLPGGLLRSDFALSAVRDGSLAFDAAGVARAWRSGFAIGQAIHDEYRFDFHIVLDGPGQTGYQLNVGDGVSTSSPLRWEIEGGAMVARRYRDNRGWQVECTVGVDGCVVYLERRWTPMSASGGRIYVHEELWMMGPADGGLEMYSQRGNFYDAG
ncbi:Ig-like domain-containing protein [Luteimonas sp. MC1572]|uniref:Ig-like domain-containing protein n=1 Tax=Luteimonas sp. MC1572 TaxID=2799325 RepID=UPI0018F0FF0E|nr:Ig-like domain-containing protein [Luteimonas sp. MC1572]MBJ6981832.1 hypothetical protein [Luteimonas sp. MC1572]QQO03114.1 hypothetical protein JGR64_13325 [Luteimonas sp. MC1572]